MIPLSALSLPQPSAPSAGALDTLPGIGADNADFSAFLALQSPADPVTGDGDPAAGTTTAAVVDGLDQASSNLPDGKILPPGLPVVAAGRDQAGDGMARCPVSPVQPFCAPAQSWSHALAVTAAKANPEGGEDHQNDPTDAGAPPFQEVQPVTIPATPVASAATSPVIPPAAEPSRTPDAPTTPPSPPQALPRPLAVPPIPAPPQPAPQLVPPTAVPAQILPVATFEANPAARPPVVAALRVATAGDARAPAAARTPDRPHTAADVSPEVSTPILVSAPLPGAPAAPPAAASAHPAVPAHDFASVIDRLTAARDAAQPQTVSIALSHREFGAVQLHFRHDDGALGVTVAGNDPDLARAVAAAPPVVASTIPDHAAPPPASGHPRGGDSGGSGQSRSGDQPGRHSDRAPHGNPSQVRQPRRDDGARQGIFA